MSSITDAMLLALAGSLVATLFALLVAILGWLGNKIYSKLEEMNLTMGKISADLHGKISDLDRRVTRVEVRCHFEHEDRDEDRRP